MRWQCSPRRWPGRRPDRRDLFGERRHVDQHARKVDAFARLEHAAVRDGGDHVGVSRVVDLQFNIAVVEQNTVAGVEIPRQAAERGGNDLLVPLDRASGDSELLSVAQCDRVAVGETLNTDLWALQVLQDADGYPEFGGSLPDIGDQLGVILVRAVREVEPGHIHSGFDEGFDFFDRVG